MSLQGTIQPGLLIENKYRISSVLGAGSMGMVVLAEELALKRNVAIKLVSTPEDPREAEHYRDLFAKEAAMMAQVQHPNVAQVYNYGQHEGVPYFVMQYIPGADLGDFIARQQDPIPVDVALGIMRQVSGGLDAIHQQGIVHRDIKPENIVIGPKYTVYIVDFGISVASMTTPATLAGTPPYIAPEVITGTPIPENQRHACDLFALAVCMFELLTGRWPFDIPRTMAPLAVIAETIKQHPISICSVREDLPFSFENVFSHALSRNISDRYPSAKLFHQALVEARDDMSQLASVLNSRVLVVDDDPDIRRLFQAVLEVGLPDARVHCASDGLFAMEMTRALSPHLIVLDLNMPNVNGLELCAMLQERHVGTPAKIIVVSGNITDAVERVLYQMGATAVFRKPIRPRELADAAKRILSQENDNA